MKKPGFDREAWFTVWVVVALFVVCLGAAAVTGIWAIWPELRIDVMERPTAAIRNILLMFSLPVALLALYLTWRRTTEIVRQGRLQLRQEEFQIAGKRDERFQSAVEKFAQRNPASTIAALVIFENLQQEDPETYDEPICRIMRAGISQTARNLTEHPKELTPDGYNLPDNLAHQQIVFDAIGKQNWYDKRRPGTRNAMLSFSSMYLGPKYNIFRRKYRGFIFTRVKFDDVAFLNCDLAGAYFYQCHFQETAIYLSNLEGAFFDETCVMDELKVGHCHGSAVGLEGRATDFNDGEQLIEQLLELDFIESEDELTRWD